MIVTDKRNLAIWITDTPFKKKSGVWSFYDTKEEYEWDLDAFKQKYGSKLVVSLEKIKKLYKEKGEPEDDE